MAENKKIVAVNLIKLEIAPIGADGAAGTVFEEIPTVHEETFNYEETEPETKEYKDVKGDVYYVSKKPGSVKINASIGRYDLKTKEKFQGGKFITGEAGKPGAWNRVGDPKTVEYTVRGTTEDGVRVIFPRASVVATGKANEKAIGLALTFTALKPTKEGEPLERWEDGEDTSVPQG